MDTALVRRAFQALVALLMVAGIANATAAGYFVQSGKVFDASGQEVQIRGDQPSRLQLHDPAAPVSCGRWAGRSRSRRSRAWGSTPSACPSCPTRSTAPRRSMCLSYVDPNLNPELIGKTPLQVLDLWMAEADRQGMYVLLDFYSVSKQTQYPTWFRVEPGRLQPDLQPTGLHPGRTGRATWRSSPSATPI